MKPLFYRIALIAGVLLLTSCSFLPWKIGNASREADRREKEIAALKIEYEGKIEKKGAEVSAAKDKVIAAKDAQITAASSGLYGADATFKTIAAPVRTDLIVNNFVNESWVALGRQAPDYQTLTKINERIRIELDESRTSLAQLQANHQKIMAENQKLVDLTKSHEQALKLAEKQREELTAKFSKELTFKQGELIAVQDKLIALEKQRADDKEAIQAMKMKFSMILGGLALAALAGAIYSPVFKAELAVLSGIAGLLSVGIWYVEAWHIGLAAGLFIVGLVVWALVKHRKEERVADALTLAVQDLKNGSKEVWESTVRPAVEERLKKYKKGTNGKLVAVADPAIEKHIDNKLASFDAK